MPETAPAYLALGADEVARRGRVALASLEACSVCPRLCGVNRLKDETRVCRTGRYARVSSAFAHFGEEACLSGTRGSGTIFFACCNLACVFCQNHELSQTLNGREQSPDEVAELMLGLERQGCHNINLVTPSHVVPQVLEALPIAIRAGLAIPLVYNSGGYDSLETLRQLDGIVDIYMPDFKISSPKLAASYLGAPDYPAIARAALTEMHRQVGPLQVDAAGVAQRGLLVRHLVMPGLPDETRAVFSFLASLSRDTRVNVMGQYRPGYLTHRHPELDHPPSGEDMSAAIEALRAAGLTGLDDRLPRRLAVLLESRPRSPPRR